MTAEVDLKAARESIRRHWLMDEASVLKKLVKMAELPAAQTSQISRLAQKLIMISRDKFLGLGGIDAFLHEYDLSSQEGVVLMCLAESLLRIPDADTADLLIQDKLSHGDWSSHLGHSHSVFVNASTWGLMLTGRLVSLDQQSRDPKAFINRLINRSGEPFIRAVLKEAMHIVARQFVMGRDIHEAVERSQDKEMESHLFSFDMLGEAAINQDDAERYYEAYQNAIQIIQSKSRDSEEPFTVPLDRPGISIKLSALHPRLDIAQRARVSKELVPKVINLATQAMQANIGLTIDAEEAERLEIQLDVFEAVFRHSRFRDWSGLGIAVQAYQKRALPVLEWLAGLSEEYGRVIMVRLVKGAYWDNEIKRAQELGLENYPVFTRKVSTDISFLACARYISHKIKSLFPQFATHNAYTIASVIEIMRDKGLFEFQCLHGMGQSVYKALQDDSATDYPVRVYAPVGSHHDLLPYLVRRLLENGANTSFLNRFAHQDSNMNDLITPPTELLASYKTCAHPKIPLPGDLYAPQRRNSAGTNLFNPETIFHLEQCVSSVRAKKNKVGCLINGKLKGIDKYQLVNPGHLDEPIGYVLEADDDIVLEAVEQAHKGFADWSSQTVETRANILDKAADLLEQRRESFLSFIVREGGRCIPDAVSEIREAVDFCRYYAKLAREQFSPTPLPGPTGEYNELRMHGRGVFACISPWNFPLAIFTGQIVAALAAGNTVVAKPARQTPITAFNLVKLLFDAGVPKSALQLLTGSGPGIGEKLFDHPAIQGVAFTGSTETAEWIQQRLTQRAGPMIPLIAETGGINAMIVDSSALPEQVVKDVMVSAFNSAGQRCSALRVLFVQDSIADSILKLLVGAMQELQVGDPALIATDIGPVIDQNAINRLVEHKNRMENEAQVVYTSSDCNLDFQGYYFNPCVFELDSLQQLQSEVFGPILHVIRFSGNQVDNVLDAINQSQFGLTLGIQSRIESTVKKIVTRARVGNIYVNRNMIGAVVGVQPFGGEGKSGTGPKAGGPNYLKRFATERTLSVNTAAIGGNATLLSLKDED